MLKKTKLRIEDFIEITEENTDYSIGKFNGKNYIISGDRAMEFETQDEIDIFWRLKGIFNEESEEIILKALASIGFETFKLMLFNDKFSSMLGDQKTGVHFLEGLGLKIGGGPVEEVIRDKSSEEHSNHFT